MLPDPGMSIWQQKTGTPWPFRGWWGRQQSLDMEIFDTPVNEWTYKEYLKVCEDPNSLKILATGRLQKAEGMRKRVEEILNNHNLSFDEVWVVKSSDELQDGNGKNGIYLNWGGDTFDFKTKLFEKLIKITECDHFVMYDDRQEHLPRFEEWAAAQSVKITIVDVVNKQKITIN
jgi:hypothetical protein